MTDNDGLTDALVMVVVPAERGGLRVRAVFGDETFRE